MPTECELGTCGRKAFRTVEDMEDGQWLTVCKFHYRKFTRLGRLFDGRIDLR